MDGIRTAKLYRKKKYYHITPSKDNDRGVERFLKHCRPTVHKNIKSFLNMFDTTSLTFSLIVGLQYFKIKPDNDEVQITDTYHYSCKNQIVLNKNEMQHLVLIRSKIKTTMREVDFGIYKINYIRLNLNKYTPLKGSSYIELPKTIRKLA